MADSGSMLQSYNTELVKRASWPASLPPSQPATDQRAPARTGVEELRARRDQLDYVIEQEGQMRAELERELNALQVRQNAACAPRHRQTLTRRTNDHAQARMRKVDEALNAKRALRDTIAATLAESEAAYAQARRLTSVCTRASLRRGCTLTDGRTYTAFWRGAQIVDRSAALLRRLQEL
jgi:hypothetical protein